MPGKIDPANDRDDFYLVLGKGVVHEGRFGFREGGLALFLQALFAVLALLLVAQRGPRARTDLVTKTALSELE